MMDDGARRRLADRSLKYSFCIYAEAAGSRIAGADFLFLSAEQAEGTADFVSSRRSENGFLRAVRCASSGKRKPPGRRVELLL